MHVMVRNRSPLLNKAVSVESPESILEQLLLHPPSEAKASPLSSKGRVSVAIHGTPQSAVSSNPRKKSPTYSPQSKQKKSGDCLNPSRSARKFALAAASPVLLDTSPSRHISYTITADDEQKLLASVIKTSSSGTTTEKSFVDRLDNKIRDIEIYPVSRIYRPKYSPTCGQTDLRNEMYKLDDLYCSDIAEDHNEDSYIDYGQVETVPIHSEKALKKKVGSGISSAISMLAPATRAPQKKLAVPDPLRAKTCPKPPTGLSLPSAELASPQRNGVGSPPSEDSFEDYCEVFILVACRLYQNPFANCIHHITSQLICSCQRVRLIKPDESPIQLFLVLV